MNNSNPDVASSGIPHGRPSRIHTAALLLALGSAACWTGCTKPGQAPPEPEVKTVTAYGMTLDENATPKQVAYVLLRALADDVHAAQERDQEALREAQELTHSLAAFSTIEKRMLGVLDKSTGTKKKDLGEERNEKLFEFTRGWGAIVSHYVASFETDAEKAMARMHQEPAPQEDSVYVLYEVAHDPDQTDPEKKQTALLEIELVQEKSGSKTYWRVAKLSYRGYPKQESPEPPTTSTAPAV